MEAAILEHHVVKVLVVGDRDEGVEILEHRRPVGDDVGGRRGSDLRKAKVGDYIRAAAIGGERVGRGKRGKDGLPMGRKRGEPRK